MSGAEDATAAIRRMYDAEPWRAAPMSFLVPNQIAGLARLFGCASAMRDVIDLGCGTGVALAHVADMPGRLLGVDVSPVSCELARERLADGGARTEILCEDLLTLAPETLGQADLVLLLGVLYVTPPADQARLLQVAAGAVRPGGVAVISYPTGPRPVMRAALYRTLRAAVQRGGDVTADDARTILIGLRDSLNADEAEPLVLGAIDATLAMNEAAFFHEVLGPHFEAMQTAELEARLAGEGLQFLGYLPATPCCLGDTSVLRALLADRDDLAGGGYRFALFGRREQDGPPDLAAAGVGWTSVLERRSQGVYGMASDPSLEITVPDAPTSALVDAMADMSLSWKDACTAGLGAGAWAVLGEDQQARVRRNVFELCRLGGVIPLAV